MALKRSPAITPGYDYLQLFEHMLKDKFVNRSLDTIIKDWCIVKLLYPEDIEQTPGIRLLMGGWRAGEFGINLDREGTIGDKIVKLLIIEGYMVTNQQFKYNDILYEGSENGLPVIQDVILRIVSENQQYSTPDMPGISFDMITMASEFWFARYNNDMDCQAFQMGFEIQYEKEYL